jgi:hypothetical protein
MAVTSIIQKTSHHTITMKAGRPSYHVRSKWLTVTTPNGVLYFELDAKGNLVKGRVSKLTPHHVIGTRPSAEMAPKQPLTVPILTPPAAAAADDPMLFWDDITLGASLFTEEGELSGAIALESCSSDLLGLTDDW